jgi:hypothetical protein
MILKRNFIQSVLDEVIEEFSEKIVPIDNKIELRFESREDHLKSVKDNPFIQEQIRIGLYKDIEKEYVGFAVVYNNDKSGFLKLMGFPYKITIAYDIAKAKLKPFKPNQVKEYLKYVLVHELTHIYEEKIKKENPTLWINTVVGSHFDETIAKENLANDVADMLCNKALVESVERELWKVTRQRADLLKRKMRR